MYCFVFNHKYYKTSIYQKSLVPITEKIGKLENTHKFQIVQEIQTDITCIQEEVEQGCR